MGVSTLILLGAAGGLLRGLLDIYTQFVNWQADRRAHRQSAAIEWSDPPPFQEYYDPVADPIAAVIHSGMGAGAAVLFGTTGQISGAYAAVVVGMSAPMLLTQLSRIQSVNDVVTDGTQAPGAAVNHVVADGTQALGASEAEAISQPAPTAPPPNGMRSGDQVRSRRTADRRQAVGEEGTP